MNHLDKIFNNPVQRIDEIIAEIFPSIQDDLRKQKACKIEDIMRGLKLAQLYEPKAREYMADPIKTFDALYEMDMHTLEAYSIALDNCNTAYMRKEVEKNNRADWNKPDKDLWR